ncbi:phage tail terminator family protein [Metaclostridioides mangenotii]|uniref:phage tail terminator family protein n=1 Tax=Metaclostridioides mangenotii TaxID=1540 RepID=UPI00046735A1|nr:hypothetical protein [Clostridioides mangenotii]
MINRLIDGISIRLNELFGDDYNIYTETVEQGFKEPCFFIKSLDPSKTQYPNKQSLREYLFDVMYFPESNDTNSEINSVTEDLFEGLEVIELLNGDLKQGIGMHAETVDDKLHFIVNYNVIVRKIEQYENMEALEIYQNIKE